MSGGLGPLGSRACGELVKEFYQCRRQRGMIGMLAGDCSTLFQDMQVCLDEESKQRRKANLQASKERMAKLGALEDLEDKPSLPSY